MGSPTGSPAGKRRVTPPPPPASELKKRKPGPRILRAAVVQSGKVIEEKRLRTRSTLSIGKDPKSTFVIADPVMPKKHELFVVRGGKYELVFTDAMRGMVAGDRNATPVDFETLKSQGLVKKKGGFFRLPLTDKHRGKVVLGETTIIFQFVVAPPMPAKVKLPAAARGGIFQSIDWPFAAALALVFVLEAPVIAWFQFAPQPKAMTLENMGDRWAKLIVPEYKPEARKKELEKKKDEPDPNNARADRQKRRKEEAEDEPEVKAKREKRRAKIRTNIQRKGILAVLGTLGESGTSGAVADVFSDGGLTTDFDSAFEGIAGVGLATARNRRSTRGGRAGEAASIGGLATSGGGKVGVGGKAERRVASVKTATPEVDGDLDSGAIARVVRSRMRMVKNCYERELKRNPGLGGKIEVEFTIGEDGRIEEALVIDNAMGSDAVADCILGRLKRWRFPKPDGGSVTVSYPFIFTSS